GQRRQPARTRGRPRRAGQRVWPVRHAPGLLGVARRFHLAAGLRRPPRPGGWQPPAGLSRSGPGPERCWRLRGDQALRPAFGPPARGNPGQPRIPLREEPAMNIRPAFLPLALGLVLGVAAGHLPATAAAAPATSATALPGDSLYQLQATLTDQH